MLLPDLYRLVAWRARHHLDAGNVEAVIAIARRYTRLRPRDPKAWILCSQALSEQDEIDDDEKERVLREGLKRNPRSIELLVAVAWVVGWNNQKALTPAREAEADQLLRTAISLDPSDPWAYLGRMRLAASQDRWKDVEKHGEEARRRISITEHMAAFWSLINGLLHVPGQARCLEILRETVADDVEWAYPHLYIAALTDGDEAAAELATAKEQWKPEPKQTFEEAIDDVKGKVAEAKEWINDEAAVRPRDDDKQRPSIKSDEA